MTADPQFNAPMDAEPDLATTYPERYAVVWLMDGVAGTPVYKCHTEERGNFEVGRTYLRDALGIHGDPRWPVQSIAGTANEAMEALGQPSSAHIPAVAVPVKAAMELFPGLPFAEDGYHPTLGVQVVP